MALTPGELRAVHIEPVRDYLAGQRDRISLRALNEGENELLINGGLEIAINSFQAVFDAIPNSALDVQKHAHLILVEAKRCDRYNRQ